MGRSYGPVKPGEQQRSMLDTTKTQRALGWQPRVALDEGLRQTVDWFLARG